MRQRPKPMKSKAKVPVAPKSPRDEGAKVRDLEKRLAEALKRESEAQGQLQTRNRELVEAREQQTATSEILRVISSSPTDAQPVFDAILRSAVTLCNSLLGNVVRVDGDLVRLVATRHPRPEEVAAIYPAPVTASLPTCRAIRENTVIHVPDVEAAGAIPPAGLQVTRAAGIRSLLVVPMRRDEQPIGAILIARLAVGPFPDEQIALLQTFADQAVIAIENVRLFTEFQARNRELTEALEQQTATSEVLRAMSGSAFDLAPVLEALIENATRLCNARHGYIFKFDGELLHPVADYGASPAFTDYWRQNPIRPGPNSTSGRAALEHRTVHIHDVTAEPGYEYRSVQSREGFRTVLAVPMLREGALLGVIALWKTIVEPFSDRQIELITTFADQAVIAIENVRLFKELEARNNALIESLDQQTATGEVLRVIAGTQTDAQPVFDTIAANALRLCTASNCAVFRFDGELIHVVALQNVNPQGTESVRKAYPVPPSRGNATARAILTRDVVDIPDVCEDAEYQLQGMAATVGFRSVLAVPMLREGNPIGAISVTGADVAAFSDNQVELLQTFADQALIAIENVRLFKELETRNRDLTEALDKQTATSEILRVISGSQTDVQPVFDTIIQSAVRLLGGFSGVITQIIGEQLHLAALTSTNPSGDAAQKVLWPKSVKEDASLHGVVITALAPHFVTDVEADRSVPPIEVAVARARGYRSIVAVPLLRDGRAVGSMAVTRHTPGPFSDGQLAVLQTFADQAVIAIENVRLFKELEARTHDLTRSVGELRALGEVGQAISSTLDLQTVLSTIVARATQLSGTDAGVIYEYDEQREIFVPRATEHLEAEIVETMLTTPVRKGEGATGRLAEIQEPIQVPDILAAPAESRVRGALVRAGYRALLAVPLVREDHLIGGLTVIRKATGEFAPEVIDLLRTFATQSALAIQNARLFLEIEDKSRQLAIASQHKSEFLANMSHELRTPLNAIIGFSEVLTDRMFGELNEKQEEYLKDIYSSGTHLLSLINDILDLSKIEAGRMELELTDFDLPTALDSALTLVRERAGRRGIALHMNVDSRLGQIQADERKVRQVVLNLLSNAIKFTPEGGRIEVRAAPVDASVEVSVTDTGVGIAPDDQEAVFEEFRQVGTADKKVEGTGLGLTLCRKFVELHGGRIWVTSEMGVGSTFTFTLPVHRGE
jgi:two-component system, NtrC family, sensor kinase